MIRTNLATRPFYNVGVVHAVIGAVAIVVLAITVFNVIQTLRLSASQRTLGAQAQQAEREAARLRAEAQEILARIDRSELEEVGNAAREANGIIDQRTFSWTNLFAHFEATLPADARVTSVTPQPTQGIVVIGAEARRVEDLDAFIEGLEMTGAFRNVLPLSEQTMDSGVIRAAISATFEQPARGTARRR
jgi:hypothetical protein